MSKPQPPQLVRNPLDRKGRRGRVIVIFEDTAENAPRTWSVGIGTVDLANVDLEDVNPEANATAAQMYALRYLDELDLLDSPRSGS